MERETEAAERAVPERQAAASDVRTPQGLALQLQRTAGNAAVATLARKGAR